MKILHLLFHSVIVSLIVFSCFLLNGFARDIEETKATKGNAAPRLVSFFDIGEKSVGKEAKQAIRSLDNFDSINAFSILDVKLKLDFGLRAPCGRGRPGTVYLL